MTMVKPRTRQILLVVAILLLYLLVGVPMGRILQQQSLNRSLIAAIRHHAPSTAAELLQQGADPNCHEDAEQPQPVWKILRARILRQPLTSPHTLPALLLAARPGGDFEDLLDAPDSPLNPLEHPDMARVLLEHGADPNARDSNGFTTLLYAIRWQKYEAVTLLLEHKADPDEGDKNNETPLMIAVYMTDPKAMRLLLDHGAHVDKRENISGQTALILALTLRRPACIKLLMTQHPDLTVRDNNGKSALDYGRELGYSALLNPVKQAPVAPEN